MARYPGAAYRPLATKQTQPPMKAHDIVCLHTMVGYLTSTDAMFRVGGYSGTESHFGIGGKWGGDFAGDLDGAIFQWQDTTFTADANFEGNWHVLSIETADNAPKVVAGILPWTPKQLAAIIRLVAWLCLTHDIPPVLIPDTKPGRRGIAYHRQGCQHSDGVGTHPGYLVKGGERWSVSTGKECPGPRRIAQVIAVVIPGVQALLAEWKSEADMPTLAEIVAALKPIIRAECKAAVIDTFLTAAIVPNRPDRPVTTDSPAPPPWTVSGVLAAGDLKADRQAQAMVDVKRDLDALIEAQPASPSAPTGEPRGV